MGLLDEWNEATGNVVEPVVEKVVQKQTLEEELKVEADYNKYAQTMVEDAAMENVNALSDASISNQNFTVLPEPLEFINHILTIDNVKDRKREIQKIIEKQTPIAVDTIDDTVWFNSSKDGINLRPGMENGQPSLIAPVQLGDDIVHALIAGRTGSGKSVFLNNLLSSMMLEYAPWELTLYLIDFKKVELSRYLSNQDNQAPHIDAVAATSSVSYALSVLRKMRDEMNAREDLFKSVGLTNIREFRNEFSVVLPRMLLIVDEFQQMFLNAKNQQLMEIETILTEITKKGRSAGVHLMFASQELSGTLSGNVLGNFKGRFVLPVNDEISSTLINSTAGASLAPHHVLFGTSDGKPEDLKKYLVPYLETNQRVESHAKHLADISNRFGDFIAYLNYVQKQTNFNKTHSYFEEEIRRNAEIINEAKKAPQLQQQIAQAKTNYTFSDFLLFGESVAYSKAKNALEYVFMENSKGANVGIQSDSWEQVSQLTANVMLNLKENKRHVVLSANKTFDNYVSAESILGEFQRIADEDELAKWLRVQDMPIDDILDQTIAWLDAGIEANSDNPEFDVELYTRLAAAVRSLNVQNDFYDFAAFIDYVNNVLLSAGDGFEPEMIQNVLNKMTRVYQGIQQLQKEETVVWVLGTENLTDDFFRENGHKLTSAPTEGMRFVFVQHGVSDDAPEWVTLSRYIFLKSSRERDYDRLRLNPEGLDNETFAVFSDRNAAEQQTFKMFKNQAVKDVPPLHISFDEL